jgi:hypothetical protein
MVAVFSSADARDENESKRNVTASSVLLKHEDESKLNVSAIVVRLAGQTIPPVVHSLATFRRQELVFLYSTYKEESNRTEFITHSHALKRTVVLLLN